MNSTARTHIDKAATCIRASDSALLQAAAEIRAAMTADASLTFREVGEALGRSHDWVSALLRWAEDASEGTTMFSSDRQARLVRATRQGLRELSEEELGELLIGEVRDKVREALWKPAETQYTPPPDEERHALFIKGFETRLSRLDGAAWSIRYDWMRYLTNEEREHYAPRLRAIADKLTQELYALIDA
jgi:hypothetical protein